MEAEETSGLWTLHKKGYCIEKILLTSERNKISQLTLNLTNRIFCPWATFFPWKCVAFLLFHPHLKKFSQIKYHEI